MKRLWISVTLLLFLFSSTLANTYYLSSFTMELTELLSQAEYQGEAGNWEAAIGLTKKARQIWESHSLYLHTTLRHADIDNVYLLFLQTQEFLDCRESGEYSAANATLMGQLKLLCEQEKPSIENIL